MKLPPIAIISFNRPDYLNRVLASLRAQKRVDLPERDITLFQDGGFNESSHIRYCDESVINECVHVFRKYFPHGEIDRASSNLGVAMNFDRAERAFFVTRQEPWAIFLEDDLEFSPLYMETMLRLWEFVQRQPNIGYFAAIGDHLLPLATQHAEAGEIGPLGHNWAFGLTRAQWLRSRPYVDQYVNLLKNHDYRHGPTDAITTLVQKWGGGVHGISQDGVKTLACHLTGGLKIGTKAVYGRYIGRIGVHFDSELFDDLGYERTVMFDGEEPFTLSDNAKSDVNLAAIRAKLAAEARNFVLEAPPLTAIPTSALSGGVTEEEVHWLYRCFFGRVPEGAGAIAEHVRQPSFDAARRAFFKSKEFLVNLHDVPIRQGVYYRPHIKRQPSVAATCIVKNEASRIGRMLTSILLLVETVIVVDTGSIDDTIEVARRLLKGKPHVIEQIVFEDFAHARNIALSLVPPSTEWVLVLDADEHLVEEDIELFLELMKDEDVDLWRLPRYNFVDEEKKQPVVVYPDFQARFFRNMPTPLRYRGRVHEVIDHDVRRIRDAPMNEGGQGDAGGPHIHHMGEVGLSKEKWSEKVKFYDILKNS